MYSIDDNIPLYEHVDEKTGWMQARMLVHGTATLMSTIDIGFQFFFALFCQNSKSGFKKRDPSTSY